MKNIFNVWVWLGGIVLAGIVLVCVGLLITTIHPTQNKVFIYSTPVVTKIPAPTFTPVLAAVTAMNTPTPETSSNPSQPDGSIKVGIYVQILGTSGDGLRIRSDAGIGNSTRFIGMDSEVFLVKEGPVQADNLTWWLLEAPYDKSRTGWAAGSYLGLVKAPQ
ncbi:MAG TPA: hypothetical protein VF326_09785 [Anaerolineaceae bacterium]|jgi:hypothetical protein